MDFGKPYGFLEQVGVLLGVLLLGATAFLAIGGLVFMGKALREASGNSGSVLEERSGYDDWKGFGIACFLAQANVLALNFIITWGGMTSWASLWVLLGLAALMLGAQVLYFHSFREGSIRLHFPLFSWAVIIGLLFPMSWLLAQGRIASFDPVLRISAYIVNAAGLLLFLAALGVMVSDRFLMCALQTGSAAGLIGWLLVLARLPEAGLPARLAIPAGLFLFFAVIFLFLILRPLALHFIEENSILVRGEGARALRLQTVAVLFFLSLLVLPLVFLHQETEGFRRLDAFLVGGSAREAALSAGRVLAAVLVLAAAAEALANLVLAAANSLSLMRKRRTRGKIAARLGARAGDFTAGEDGNILAAGTGLVDQIIRKGSLEAALLLSEIVKQLDPRLNMFIVNALLERGDRSAAAIRHYSANVNHFLAGCIDVDEAARPGLVKSVTAFLFLGASPPPPLSLARPKSFAAFSKLAACRDLLSDEYGELISRFFHGCMVTSRNHTFPAAFDRTLALVRSGQLAASCAVYREECRTSRDWGALEEAYLLGPFDLTSCLALIRNCPEAANADFYRLDLYENGFLPWFSAPPASNEPLFVRELFTGKLPRGAVTITPAPLTAFLKTVGAEPMDDAHPLLAPLAGILRQVTPSQIEALCWDGHNNLASAHALLRALRRIPSHAALVRRSLENPLMKVSDASRTEEGCGVAELIFRADCLCRMEEGKKENDDEEQRAGPAAPGG